MADLFIPTLNLAQRPTIGDKLSKSQYDAIERFYLHIQENLMPDQFGIYRNAYMQLSKLNFNFRTFQPGVKLTKEQQVELSILYRQILAIHTSNKTDIIVPETEQTKIVQACDSVLKDLTTPTPEFNEHEAEQSSEHAKLTEANKQEHLRLREHNIHENEILVRMLRKAIQDERNYTLDRDQIKIIKDSLG